MTSPVLLFLLSVIVLALVAYLALQMMSVESLVALIEWKLGRKAKRANKQKEKILSDLSALKRLGGGSIDIAVKIEEELQGNNHGEE